MNWLALSPMQAVALVGAAAAVAVWLYLRTRQPRHRRVSTLRFWASVQPVAQPRRRRLREPWALLAQLMFLLLLIVALANPRWGDATGSRNVVMVLDNSVWSQVRAAGEPTWMDGIHQEGLRVLDSLPASDPVLLLTSEPDAPPLLPFTTDRAALRKAIAAAQSSSTVADVPRALEAGKAALAGAQRGLLVYVGPGMVDEQQAHRLDAFRQGIETPGDTSGQMQFLVRLVSGSTPVQNRGITRLSLRRDPAQPTLWHLLAQLKNYNQNKAEITLKLSVNAQPLGEQAIALTPNETASVEQEFVWSQGGVVQAEITTPDALDADNRASLNIPSFRPARVALIATDSPFSNDLLTAVVSDPYVQVELVRPGANPLNTPDVGIYESARPPQALAYDSIWFLKGKRGTGGRPVRVTAWNPQHPVTRWIRSRDVSVRNPATLEAMPGDTVLATVEGNAQAPLILAREQGGHRLVLVGFDPDDSNFALQSAFPLLMAGSIEWMTHSVEEIADSLSTGEVSLPGPAKRIIAPSGKDVAFASDGQNVHLLATEMGMYRVIAASGETKVPVNVPLLPARRLQATQAESAGVESESPVAAEWDLWRWLAALAVVALWLEWWLYYSGRRKQELAERWGEHAGLTQSPFPPAGATGEHTEDHSPHLVS